MLKLRQKAADAGTQVEEEPAGERASAGQRKRARSGSQSKQAPGQHKY